MTRIRSSADILATAIVNDLIAFSTLSYGGANFSRA
jgi:hypothetical protein